jgi:hypothetical protein
MTLQRKLQVSGHPDVHPNDDIYASTDLSRGLPKRRFPEEERDPRTSFAAMRDELQRLMELLGWQEPTQALSSA